MPNIRDLRDEFEDLVAEAGIRVNPVPYDVVVIEVDKVRDLLNKYGDA